MNLEKELLHQDQFESKYKSRYKNCHEQTIPKEKQVTPSEVKETFCHFDTNNDGVISTEELERLLESIGVHVSRRSVVNMMAEVGGQGKYFYFDTLIFHKNQLCQT